MTQNWQNSCRRAAELVYLEWVGDWRAACPLIILLIHFWVKTRGGCSSLTHYKGQLSIISWEGLGGKKVTICRNGMDEAMRCKLPWALQQHPLPTLHATFLGQSEERYIRARPQGHSAFPLFLFTYYFCMTLVMKLKTLVQLQAAILGSIASSPDTEITICQASN